MGIVPEKWRLRSSRVLWR